MWCFKAAQYRHLLIQFRSTEGRWDLIRKEKWSQMSNTQTQTSEKNCFNIKTSIREKQVKMQNIIFGWMNSINQTKHNKLKWSCLIGLDIYNFIDSWNMWTLLHPNRCDTGHKRNNERWKIFCIFPQRNWDNNRQQPITKACHFLWHFLR